MPFGYYPNLQSIDICDGDVENAVFPQSEFMFPNAHVSKDPKCTPARLPPGRPMLIVYRPLDATIGVFDVGKLALTDSKSEVEGQPCLLVKHAEDMIWVDPAKDFVPTRYRAIEGGVTWQWIDITYAADVQHGWIPKFWKQVVAPSGTIWNTTTLEVVEYKIGADSVSDETFTVQYPPGTWVRDYIHDKSWIVREDGSRRMVLKSEDGKDYKDLIESPTPNLTRRRFPWLAAVGGLVLVLLVAVCCYRARKRRKSSAVAG
jgi:hypothetical protein